MVWRMAQAGEKEIMRKIFVLIFFATVAVFSSVFAEDELLIKTLKGHTGWVSSVSFSPDGKYLASGN